MLSLSTNALKIWKQYSSIKSQHIQPCKDKINGYLKRATTKDMYIPIAMNSMILTFESYLLPIANVMEQDLNVCYNTQLIEAFDVNYYRARQYNTKIDQENRLIFQVVHDIIDSVKDWVVRFIKKCSSPIIIYKLLQILAMSRDDLVYQVLLFLFKLESQHYNSSDCSNESSILIKHLDFVSMFCY